MRRSLEGRRRRKKEVKQKNKDMKANKIIYLAEAAAPESGEAAEETAAEYQEAAADLVKTAAAVVVGFFGFYLTFAIFGI